jgi:hypothetical protein
VAQPSKAGAIVLFLFGLPFFAFGAFATFAFFTSAPSVHNNSNPIAGAIFASVFAIIGAGIMFGAVYGYWAQKRDAAVKEANPQSPWLWRSDWAQSRALSSRRNTLYGWWVGAVLTSMLFVPMAAITVPAMLRSGDPKALFLLGLCLIPAALLAGAVRATIRRQRYGQTYFEFAALPFSPGKKISGQIQLRLDSAVEHGIDLRLSCIRRIVTGSGKEQSTSNVPLWQQEKNVPPSALMIGPAGSLIPVEFEIPEEAYETNHDVPSDQLLWMLHAHADVPGVDYSEDFEIPVFRSTAKAARASAALGDADWTPEFRPHFGAGAPVADSLAAPAHPKVVISTAPEGATEFYFPAFRNPGRTLFLLLFTAGWTAVVYFLAHSNAPRLFPVVFGLFDLMLVYGCMQGLFGRARIVVGSGKLVSQRGTFSMGTGAEIPFSDIESVHAAAGVQNSNAWSASFMIQLKTRSGRTLKLADSIADREEARWIVGQIEKLAGLKLDTQVVMQDMGRDLGPPPQRDSI